jgi:hypothetical protein
VPGGHYLAEERPDDVTAAWAPFFAAHPGDAPPGDID